jgi:4-amino-4-deoxy-L-arabinose transferase-like glycosyltransferase
MNRDLFLRFIKRVIPESAKGAFWLSFSACLLGCMFVILVLSPLMGVGYSFGKTHDGYIQLADSLRQGNGYVFERGGPPVFHRPPMYPLLLVPVTCFPESMHRPVLVVVQSLMAGCIGALIFQIARYFFGNRTATLSALVFAFNPWVYFNAKNPMTTITQGLLYSLLAVLAGREFLILFNRYEGSTDKLRLWLGRLAIGIVAAVLALTHGAMLGVTVIVFFSLFAAGLLRRNWQAVKTSVIAGVVTVALISPWTYRNWAVFHRFIPVAGGAGLAYFNGNVHWKGIMEEPQRKGESYIDASMRVAGIEGTEETHTHWKGLKDIELEDRINQKMIEHLRARPVVFGKKVLLNAVEYYFPILTYPYLAVKRFRVRKLAITIFHLGLWVLALIAIWRGKKEEMSGLATGLMLAAIVLYAVWFFPFATFIGHSLYTFGTIPFLCILAAKGMCSFKRG